MPRIDLTIDVDAPALAIFALARDIERFPQYMPDVERVEILERGVDRVVSCWSTLVEDASIEWTEEDVFDDVALTIAYRAIDGDLERFEGVWSFEAISERRSRVRLWIDYDFGVPSLAELIGPTLDATVRRNGKLMLDGLRAEAERLAGGR